MKGHTVAHLTKLDNLVEVEFFFLFHLALLFSEGIFTCVRCVGNRRRPGEWAQEALPTPCCLPSSRPVRAGGTIFFFLVFQQPPNPAGGFSRGFLSFMRERQKKIPVPHRPFVENFSSFQFRISLERVGQGFCFSFQALHFLFWTAREKCNCHIGEFLFTRFIR